MQNSTYNPESVNQFEKSKLSFNGQKAKGTVLAGETKDIDLLVTEDHLLTGASVKVIGDDVDDELKLSVVHPVHGQLPSFVDWYAENFNKEIQYPAKLIGGCIIRITYKSTGINDVRIRANYSLHKVLI